MKYSLRLLTLVVALFGCVTLGAQEVMSVPAPQEVKLDDDIQARFRAILDVPLAKNLSLEWSEQVRMHNNVSDVDKILSSLGLNYKVLPWLKVGASYSFVNVRDAELNAATGAEEVEWKNRHLVNVDVTGSYKVGRVKLSLRERVRFNFRTDSVNKYEHPDPFISLRSRLKAAYDIRQCRWEPYAYVELYTTLNARNAVPNYKNYNVAYKQYINRIRFSVGTEFKINNYHRLDIYYRFHLNQGYDARYKANKGDLKSWTHEKQNCHVFGLDYKFKL
ncbi:MAG: DUF2490 domain-containing protein [Rikenellaceae bacterium]|nr:DUF2490 domain-containing protein [Rikenellaceae bacterium]